MIEDRPAPAGAPGPAAAPAAPKAAEFLHKPAPVHVACAATLRNMSIRESTSREATVRLEPQAPSADLCRDSMSSVMTLNRRRI